LLVKHRVNVIDRVAGLIEELRRNRRDVLNVPRQNSVRPEINGSQPSESLPAMRSPTTFDRAWVLLPHTDMILNLPEGMVDLERGTVADLLPQRSAEQLAEWLKQHPEVEVITRDRFGLYAGGARRGAPQARQVADRFHLLLNLREAVEKELGGPRRRMALPPVEEEDQSVTKTVPVADSGSRANPEVQIHKRELVAERWRAKKELFARVRALHLSGRSASAIVRETGVGRRRVDKWIRCTQLPTRNEMEPKPTSPRFFAAHLQRRWAEGCHDGPRLLTEIRALGYRGCYSSLAKSLARWRDHEPELKPKSWPPASVSLRQQAVRILQSPDRSLLWSPRRC
jgi:hypothetical protein